MKTVLFALNASYSHTNLAVRAIGATLRRAGFETVLVEKNLKDAYHRVLWSLYEEKAAVYGFSVYIWNVSEMLRLACELKTLLPEAAIVFGGPEVSFCDESFFARYPFVDFIIAGEGEEAFPQLCSMLSCGKTPPHILAARPYRDFVHGGIYYDEIGDAPRGLVYYESVRGCPFSCAYCLSSVTQGMRAKSVPHVLSDLAAFERYDGIRTVKLVDRTFNFDCERARTIWRALAGEAYTKEYHFEICAALLDEESFAVLARAPKGKFRLEIGVQSTNPDTLRAVHRALDTDKTLTAMKRLHAMGNLHIHADLIAGLPHEDFSSFGLSFDAVYGHCNVLQLGFLKLLLGCALRENAEKWGIRYSPYPPYEVLETADLSFDELTRLRAIEGLLERFSNSGKFPYTFPYLPLCGKSAFAFFSGLAAFAAETFRCDDISRLSQAEAFRLILDYAEKLEKEGAPICREEVRERLMIDFLLGERRRLPPFLASVPVTDKERERALSSVPWQARAGCEVVRCRFMGDGLLVVDRAAGALIRTSDIAD